MPIAISLFGQAANGNGKEGSAFPMPEQTGAAASPMPGASPAPCATLQTEDDPKAAPQRESLSEGPESRCAGYPRRCLAGCPDYRGLTLAFCRKLHWWKPWAMPGTGELPTVIGWRGHVWHSYEDGTTRLVGMDAAPSVPASVIPPVPSQVAAPTTRAERWHMAARGETC